jgi:hypothetical protein
MSIELELDERELELVIDGLFAIISHPSTNQDDWRDAADLSDFLRALGAGHFDGWGDSEEEFVDQGIEAREQAKGTSRSASKRQEQLKSSLCLVPNDPIDW